MNRYIRTAFLIAMLGAAIAARAAPVVEDWSNAVSSYFLQAGAKDRFRIEEASPGGAKVAGFTVKAGDRFMSTTGERCEVILDTWKSTSRFMVWGDEDQEFYRISVKMDADWKPPQANTLGSKWGSIFQLHGPDKLKAPPAVALLAEDKFWLYIQGGNMDEKSGQRIALSKSHLNYGSWVEFVVAVKWASGPDGQVVVYRKDEGQTSWESVAEVKSVATLQYRGSASAVEPHYWKAGFYRSESSHTNSLWLGPIVRAKTFSDAAASSWAPFARRSDLTATPTSSSTSSSSESSSSSTSSESSSVSTSSSSSSSASAASKGDSGSSSRSAAPAPRDSGSKGSSPKAVSY